MSDFKGQFIFLDDIRKPSDVKDIPQYPYTVVRNYGEFVRVVTDYYSYFEKLPTFISFDYDLSEEHYAGDYSKTESGLDCVKWLAGFCRDKGLKFPEYHVHSLNPHAKSNIEYLLTVNNL